MRLLPNGAWYEPADLGFDNVLIAASADLQGNVVPWAAGFPFSRFMVRFTLDGGASVDWTLRFSQFDIDGQVSLGSSILVSNIAAGSWAIWSGNAPQSITSTTGAPLVGTVAIAMMAPYVSFNLTNNDGVNSGTVSLRALLSP